MGEGWGEIEIGIRMQQGKEGRVCADRAHLEVSQKWITLRS